MSETKYNPMRAGWTSSHFLTFPLRTLQLLVSAVSVGLFGWLTYNWENSYEHFGLALSALSVFYLLTLPLFSFSSAGSLLIFEFAFFLLWMAAFILITYLFYDCYSWGVRRRTSEDDKRCKIGFTTIGTSGALMLLFNFTYALCFHNIIIPITYNVGRNYLWVPFSSFSARLSRGNALSVSHARTLHSPV